MYLHCKHFRPGEGTPWGSNYWQCCWHHFTV